ncbi:MAG TPA: hypothetical protein VFJ14_02410 [Nocardioidaceae bacterium]|nr:hypothetical protein [Nocardioidaceae bacterium]
MDISRTAYRSVVTGVATVFGLGLVGAGAAAVAAPNDYLAHRDDTSNEIVLAGDDDGDDDGDDGTANTNTNTKTGHSGTGNSRDGTNSVVSRASRNRDHSRDDRTKDMTRDGGDRTRDFSRNLTNDRSRNDTR